MRLLARRFVPVVTTALISFAGTAPSEAAVPPPTAAPAGSIAQCEAIYKRTQFLWTMFQKATNSSKPGDYRFADSNVWRIAPLLTGPLCLQTDKTHDRAMMDARRFEIGMLFSIAGAFTEANLRKYYNARAFANAFNAGVSASMANTKEAKAAIAVVRKERPDFNQFLVQWKREIKKLEQLLDALNIPKDAQLNPAERPAH
jgi:hypothetical protein